MLSSWPQQNDPGQNDFELLLSSIISNCFKQSATNCDDDDNNDDNDDNGDDDDNDDGKWCWW